MTQEEEHTIKKSVLMRYPASFLEEVSRALIGYKSHRDNKEYYKALPILDTLIDYVTLDPKTSKRCYDLTEEERKESRHHFIFLPKNLVESFREVYHGPRKDGKLPLRYLAPGKTIDPSKGIVNIRQPVNFVKAWGNYDPEYIIIKGGFYYKETRYNITSMGVMPYEVMVPLIDFSDPNLAYHDTDTIPFSYWTALYDSGWTLISPICTMLEKLMAETLEGAGYNPDQIQNGNNSGAGSPPNDKADKSKSPSDRLKL